MSSQESTNASNSGGAPFGKIPQASASGVVESISRGEFQNVVVPILNTLEKLEKNHCKLRENFEATMREVNRTMMLSEQDISKSIQELRLAIQPMLQEHTSKHQDRKDNRVAILSMLTAIASTVISGVVLVVVGSSP